MARRRSPAFKKEVRDGEGKHSEQVCEARHSVRGRGNLQYDTSELRKNYIATLKKDDKGEYADLVAFARF